MTVRLSESRPALAGRAAITSLKSAEREPPRMIRDWSAFALSAGERRCVGALAEALYRPGGEGLGGVLPYILDEVQAWLSTTDVVVRSGLRALLVVLEVSPIRLGFGPFVMSRLPLARRVRYLAALEERAAPSLRNWKTLLGTAYFDHPDGILVMGTASARGAS